MLQNAWLKAHGYIASNRKGAASKNNPAVAISNELHDIIFTEQDKLKLFNPKELRGMNYVTNIEKNAQAMRNAGISEHVVQTLRKEAIIHAKSLRRKP